MEWKVAQEWNSRKAVGGVEAERVAGGARRMRRGSMGSMGGAVDAFEGRDFTSKKKICSGTWSRDVEEIRLLLLEIR